MNQNQMNIKLIKLLGMLKLLMECRFLIIRRSLMLLFALTFISK